MIDFLISFLQLMVNSPPLGHYDSESRWLKHSKLAFVVLAYLSSIHALSLTNCENGI